MSDEKKIRFFGDGDSFGDGGAWVYLGDTPEQVGKAVQGWAECLGATEDSGCEIKVEFMTDAEIDALPDL